MFLIQLKSLVSRDNYFSSLFFHTSDAIADFSSKYEGQIRNYSRVNNANNTTLEINHEKLGEIRVEFVEYKKDDMTIIISSNDFTIDIYNEEMLNYSERNLNGSEIISHKIYNKNGKIMYENIKNKITHYENGYPYIEINRNNERTQETTRTQGAQ